MKILTKIIFILTILFTIAISFYCGYVYGGLENQDVCKQYMDDHCFCTYQVPTCDDVQQRIKTDIYIRKGTRVINYSEKINYTKLIWGE